jgi:hypothetical protein
VAREHLQLITSTIWDKTPARLRLRPINIKISTDKCSRIANHPNRDDDPKYIVRLIGTVIPVSQETVRIIRAWLARENLPVAQHSVGWPTLYPVAENEPSGCPPFRVLCGRQVC